MRGIIRWGGSIGRIEGWLCQLLLAYHNSNSHLRIVLFLCTTDGSFSFGWCWYYGASFSRALKGRTASWQILINFNTRSQRQIAAASARPPKSCQSNNRPLAVPFSYSNTALEPNFLSDQVRDFGRPSLLEGSALDSRTAGRACCYYKNKWPWRRAKRALLEIRLSAPVSHQKRLAKPP